MNKKVRVLLVICVLILLFTMFLIKVNNNHKKWNNHRRQSWLNVIEWDNNRLDYTGKNVSIAVIDTGISERINELSHSIDEEIKIVDRKNGIDNCEHGTAVASIITAYANNKNEVMGIATDSKIISIDVTNDEDGIVEISNLIKGIECAIEKKVDIINVSVGCVEGNEKLKKTVEKAINNNIIIVASAGNYMKQNCLFPAAYDDVIKVGSVDKKNRIISPQTYRKDVLYFPGESIVTAIGKNKYAGCDGTSFSTAVCSGLVSLLLEKNKNPKKIIEYLKTIDTKENMSFVDIINGY